ncbi:hypothetical protein [Adonisia turfae]|uniref:hypothetical protein n=1 Tax=Adonisia turfae TaxID=2950184 RepID=UPI0013D2F92C|nr:hypothetical protein [Adonisia turfae]
MINKALAKQRFEAWKTQPRDELGRFASKMASNPRVQEGIVNAGGGIGAIIGAKVAGVPGALAGDAIGAIATRQAIRITESALTASGKARRAKRLQTGKKINQMNALLKTALKEYKGREEDLKDELTEDLLGWIIGNASAAGINAVLPGLSAIPLKGMLPTMATAPKLAKILNRRRKKRGQTKS